MENNQSSNQVSIKGSIFSFLDVSRHVTTAISLQNQIQNHIQKNNIDPKKYFEENKKNPDVIALENFNQLIEACTIYCRGLEFSNSTDLIIIDQWGDFLRIWHTQGDPQIFVTVGVNKESKTLINMQSFFDKSRCFQYRSEKNLSEKEMNELGIEK